MVARNFAVTSSSVSATTPIFGGEADVARYPPHFLRVIRGSNISAIIAFSTVRRMHHKKFSQSFQIDGGEYRNNTPYKTISLT
jgi:hypothetical protein